VAPNKIIPTSQSSLFEDMRLDKMELASTLAGQLPAEREYGGPGLLLGTSAFTANGWVGSFYPNGLSPQDYLAYYAARFQTVEIDSTFYGCPSASTVNKWHLKTPLDFIISAKVPQVVTHEKMLVGCEQEFEEFVDRMSILGDKLGPLLLQFPKFDKFEMNEDEFLRRLSLFLARVKDLPTARLVVEIRNKPWLTERLLDRNISKTARSRTGCRRAASIVRKFRWDFRRRGRLPGR
jgi:uncharacterized protein YecE (DUF72 family)